MEYPWDSCWDTVRGRGMDTFGCLLVLFLGTAGRSVHFPSILQSGRRLGWPRRVGGVLASAYESSFGAFGCVVCVA